MAIKMTFKLTDDQLADALMKSIIERIGDIEDAGLDWATKRNATYIGKTEVSRDKAVGTLVDAYNVLKFGKLKHFK